MVKNHYLTSSTITPQESNTKNGMSNSSEAHMGFNISASILPH